MNKQKFLFYYFNLLLFTILFLSCEKEENAATYQSTVIATDATKLYKAEGNSDAATVWLYEQGGPIGKLVTGDLNNFPVPESDLKVYVHQTLTYNNDLYSKELTEAQGVLETAKNTEILHKVIQHFKSKGKKVIVIGHSYGAFVVTNYLADKGSEAADKYVIMAGRLDAEKALYEGLINKQYYYYPDFVTPTLHPSTQPTNDNERMELFLAGIIGKNRYTQKLKSIDLSRVIYSWAYDDDALGRLTQKERDFLVQKNVTTYEIESGGHGAMFESPHSEKLFELLLK